MTNFYTLAKTAERLANREISAVDLCENILACVENLNPKINAYSAILSETARLEAAASDERRSRNCTLGPLDGIPIAIKDLIDTTPAICKAGLEHRSSYRPKRDAVVVKRLRRAGAVIIGVTETDPGAFSTDTPQVTNPLATNRSVGGSSGGSAAVIAAGLAFGAVGTDTGGSIRIPAACCSVYGFKPTWGRVDASGVMPLASSLDHIGPLARSIEDLQILQLVLDPALDDCRDIALQTPIKLGVAVAYFEDADDDIKNAIANVIKILGQSDIETRQVTLPAPDSIMPFHMVTLPKEAADFHIRHYPEDWPLYPEIARRTVEMGRNITQQSYDQATVLRSKACADVDAALETVDALILPVMPIDAPRRNVSSYVLNGKSVSKLEATIRYTSLFNQTGHPVVAMPATTIADGRSISLQLVGKTDDDRLLLRLARKLEEALSVQIRYKSIMENQDVRPQKKAKGQL
ncbi:amidase [Epibacterium ulvae]|uniref:amidase n=1 Tax=Epibacterium ulvae TaxID=1156985 RepID=UPI001BFCB7A9|nr:amidase [Epibacterium ulvae]MBT8154693.1 amidase [Epibacterium ulvae]